MVQKSFDPKGVNGGDESGKDVLRRLLEWAERRDDVRTMLLNRPFAETSTHLDHFSGYDLLLEVRDAAVFYRDEGWLADFDPLLAVFRNPLGEREGFPASLFVTSYEDDEIDFSFVQEGYLDWISRRRRLPEDLAYGFRTLLDKDGRAASLPAPTAFAARLAMPDERAYLALVCRFHNDAAHVARALWRGDRLSARFRLDHTMKHETLLRVLDWKHGIETGCPPLSMSKCEPLVQRLDPTTSFEFELTSAGSGDQAVWEALWATVRLFRRVAKEVGEALDFAYLDDGYRQLAAYLRRVESRAL